jgi:hypothetical protein
MNKFAINQSMPLFNAKALPVTGDLDVFIFDCRHAGSDFGFYLSRTPDQQFGSGQKRAFIR